MVLSDCESSAEENMARFIFKLESILSIKEKLETQAKVEFGIEMARLRKEEEKLEGMRRKKPDKK